MTKVLVVDDELGIRTLLSEILEEEGFYVKTAEDGEHARKIVNAEKFDLILLDVWMPDTDGVTLLKEWVASRAIDCPVIMMSGHGTIETAMEATRFGAVNFLEKPIPYKLLIDTCFTTLKEWPKHKCGECVNTPKVTPPPVRLNTPQQLPIVEVPDLGIVLNFNRNFKEMREDFERAYLTRVLRLKGGSIAGLARHAEVERTHLYRKLRSLGIDSSDYTGRKNRDKPLPIFGKIDGDGFVAKR